jgi:uncharacterized lipoprotein
VKISLKLFYVFCGIILSALTLSGCQSMHRYNLEKVKKSIAIRNHAYDYLQSGLIAPLRVPSDLSSLPQDNLYPLPENLPNGRIKDPSLVPPGFGEL